jgi:O-antigen ligase
LNPEPKPSAAAWLGRAVSGCLFVFAFCAPHSIAATQAAWLLALLFWVGRLIFQRPRPPLSRTPVDYALLGFFILTFISALLSYEPDISIGKLRAASLFTIVYLVAENIQARRTVRALTLVLVASCMINVVYTFGVYAAGRGLRVEALSADSPLRRAGIREGDTLLRVDGRRLREPSELVRALEARGEGAAARGADTTQGAQGAGPAAAEPQSETGVRPRPTAVEPTSPGARVEVYRVEALPVFEITRGTLLGGETPEARLGIVRWSRGRDERASGFYGHYVTYAEVLQLVASVALGLFVASRRKFSWRGALLAASVAGTVGALLLTLTRAAWLGFLLSAFAIALVGSARPRRTLLVAAGVALPLIIAGLLVLQQKRQVGFIDPREGSTAWRLMVYRESLSLLVRRPRHLLVGVGMDSLKRRYREFDLFDHGRQNIGHLHSTPLQIAVERGLPTLFAWLALVALYARVLWRLARRPEVGHWIERGLALGALGGLVGFMASGMVHYNLGDSEVAMVFYLIMGLCLALERLTRRPADGASGPAVGRSS